MKRRLWKVLAGLVAIFTICILYYTNSLSRIRYEHNLALSNNVEIESVSSDWWIIRTNKSDRFLKCRLTMPKNEFATLLAESNCIECDGKSVYPGARYSFFPVTYGSVRHIVVVETTVDTVTFDLTTVYS